MTTFDFLVLCAGVFLVLYFGSVIRGYPSTESYDDAVPFALDHDPGPAA